MPVPLLPAPAATIATVAASTAASYFIWMVVTGLVCLVAVIRVVRRPADAWSHRNWSKVAWVLAVLYLSIPLAGYPIHVGAVAAIWHTRRRPDLYTRLGIPMAEGTPGIWEDR